METLSAMERLFSAPLPERTESYTPIAHKVIDDKTREILQDMGFTLTTSKYNSSTDGMLGQCQYNIQYGNDTEMGLMVAWQNSYNKLVSFKYAVGAHVMVCSNGMVAGDLGAYRRKHTGTADQEAFEIIRNYLSSAKTIFEKLIADREHLKQINLTPTRMAELMGKMFIENEIITSTQINIMKREMYNPTYDYGVPKHNAWALYNFATHAFKEDSPRSWMKRHIDLHDFFGKEFALPMPSEPSVIQTSLFTDEVPTEQPSPFKTDPVEEQFVIEEYEVVEEVKEEPKKESFIDFLDDF